MTDQTAPTPPTPGTSSRLLTAEEVAQRWQVTVNHVYRLSREGRLPTVELGRYKRYDIGALEAFEDAGGTGKGAAT